MTCSYQERFKYFSKNCTTFKNSHSNGHVVLYFTKFGMESCIKRALSRKTCSTDRYDGYAEELFILESRCGFLVKDVLLE